MKKLNKFLVAVCLFALAGCGSGNGTSDAGSGDSGSVSAPINVVTREDGSGTRGAFIEIFGIEEKDANGNKVDKTMPEAEITNSTSVMMQTISGNPNAIGYISLGSLNETVKAVQIDDAAATVENVKSGSYTVSRPFNVVSMGDDNEIANDFLAFIMSEEGQKVVEDNGYISQGNKGAYDGKKLSGKIVVGGSSSITPVMEKLKEAYATYQPDVTVDVQQNDSSTGISSTVEGVFDLGMASREIKDSELEKGVVPTVIALDGIAVIVNNDSEVANLTKDQVKQIYTGAVSTWDEVK